MDPLCHTLVGAALGEAGLKHRTPQAVPALLIGANLPDIDVLSYVLGPVVPLAFRRGWTHGVLAVFVLPVALAAVIAACDRLGAWWSRRRGRDPGQPADSFQLLLVSFLGVLTHPLLDFLNTYGVRWLMPVSRAWYYGDTLFIIDPWVWAVLVVGVFLSRRVGAGSRESRADHWKQGAGSRERRPAQVALLVVAAYILLMGASAVLARRAVARELAAAGILVERLMVAPVPANPLRKEVLVEGQGVYRVGTFRWLPRAHLAFRGQPLATRAAHPAAREASRTPEGRLFLIWSRFPYYLISETGTGYDVRIMDARYNADWASVTLRVRSEK